MFNFIDNIYELEGYLNGANYFSINYFYSMSYRRLSYWLFSRWTDNSHKQMWSVQYHCLMLTDY